MSQAIQNRHGSIYLEPVRASYRCLRCSAEWEGYGGPGWGPGDSTECPECGHLYVRWLDYEGRT